MKKLAALATSIATIPFTALAVDKVTYEDHVLPIFRNACNNCHNPDKKKAGLDLTTYQATLSGSENGKVVKSGSPGASLLLRCVKQLDDPKMPPKGDRLNDQDVAVIEKWIAGQLLENGTGKAVAVADNKVAVALVSLTRPEGPPPMPGELPLEPFVRTTRTNALTALAASPWAPIVAVGGQKQILLYHTATFEPLGVLPFPEGHPTIIRFSRNGQLLLTGGGFGGKSGRVVLWDIKTGDRIAALGNEVDQVLAADLSPDHQFVALGGPNKLVKIYATKDARLVASIKKHTDWVTAIAYSPDGSYLASGDRNGGIHVWEGSSGAAFNSLPGHKAMVTSLAFMPGVLASAGADGKISLWNAKEGREIRSWSAHIGGAEWVDFTPEGRIASAGRDKIAKVWDQNGAAIGKTQPFEDIVLRAVLSGDHIVAGDWTGLVRVTTLAGKELAQLNPNPPSIADRLAEAVKSSDALQSSLPGLREQIASATAKLEAETAAAEARAKADADAIEAAKALPGQIETRLAEARTQLEALTKAQANADETSRPAAGEQVATQRKAVRDLEAQFAEAKTLLREKLSAIERDRAAKAKQAQQIAELTRQVETRTASVDRIRQSRDQQKEGSSSYNEINGRLTASTSELAQARKVLAAARKSAGLLPSETAEAAAKAKAALDDANAKLAVVGAQIAKWKLARMFQTAYDARRAVLDKQAACDALVAAAKDAFQPVEQIRADLAAARKSAAELPPLIAGKEKLVAQARQDVKSANAAVAAAGTAVAEREMALKTATTAAGQISPVKVEQLASELARQTAELARLRDARSAKAAETAEYAAADKMVQAKKADIAKAQAALDDAKKGAVVDAPAIKSATADLAKAREALETARNSAKTAEGKEAAASKDLALATASAGQFKKQIAELTAAEPEAVKAAKAAKIRAENALPAARKALAAAKTQADKARADYETAKAGNTRPGLVSVPPKG